MKQLEIHDPSRLGNEVDASILKFGQKFNGNAV